MAQKPKDIWGPLRFRYFVAKSDRDNLINPAAIDRPWGAKTGEPVSESLDFGAEIRRPQATPGWQPMLRPVFPGAMRFIISPDDAAKANLPINAPGGVVDRTTLSQFAGVRGTLVVSMVAQTHFDEATQKAAIPGIEEAPNHAWYGPTQLTIGFLETALLNYTTGLLASHVPEGTSPEIIAPGDPRWAERALRGFLLGNYMPVLRAGKAADGSDDDAERLPMPVMTTDPVSPSRVALNMAFGWVRKSGPAPITPDPQLVEAIPARLLLQHLSDKLVDIEKNPTTDHSTVNCVFNGSYDATTWLAQLTGKLDALGFASLAMPQPPTDYKLREFQIAARGAFVASSPPATPQRSERDLRHLLCTTNPTPYHGIASGRANQHTRRLIDTWASARLRNPLIIFPVAMASLDRQTGRPLPNAVPLVADLWSRLEYALTQPRIFAADIASLAHNGAAFRIADAEPIGSAQPYLALGGPVGLNSDVRGYVPDPDAEMTPERMLGLPSSSLLIPQVDPSTEASRRKKLSTFKVIRAVAEQECRAYLDEVNAYDAGFLSIGLFHWAAAGGAAQPKDGNELGGLIAFLPYFDSVRGTHSARVFDDNGIASRLKIPADLIDQLRLPTGKLTYQIPIRFLTDKGVARTAVQDDIAEFLPSWRSFYRQIRAGRRDKDFALALYHVAKRRLRDISRIAFPFDPLPNDARTHPSGGPTIGSVFDSELLIAKIVRWHVNRPSAVIEPGISPIPSDYLVSAYDEAAKTNPQNETEWCIALNLKLEAELDRFIIAMGNDSSGQPKYRNLKPQFAAIETPGWIYLAGTTPKTDTVHNPRRYKLDAQLRWLSSSSGSFLLDDDIVEPQPWT